jgi:hypothetical protein
VKNERFISKCYYRSGMNIPRNTGGAASAARGARNFAGNAVSAAWNSSPIEFLVSGGAGTAATIGATVMSAATGGEDPLTNGLLAGNMVGTGVGIGVADKTWMKGLLSFPFVRAAFAHGARTDAMSGSRSLGEFYGKVLQGVTYVPEMGFKALNFLQDDLSRGSDSLAGEIFSNPYGQNSILPIAASVGTAYGIRALWRKAFGD